MLNRYCAGTARLQRLRVGPLGSHIDGFATLLARDGYALSTVHEKRVGLPEEPLIMPSYLRPLARDSPRIPHTADAYSE